MAAPKMDAAALFGPLPDKEGAEDATEDGPGEDVKSLAQMVFPDEPDRADALIELIESCMAKKGSGEGY